MLKFTNLNRTAATFNEASFSLAAPEDWDSIGDGPTREAVKAWLAVGNTPLPADAPDPKAAIQTQIDALERDALQNRGDRELALINMQDLARRKVEAYLEANPDDPTPVANLIQHELETTPYWVKLTELNAQIAALRAQL